MTGKTQGQTQAETQPAEPQLDHVDRFLAEIELPGIDLTVEGIVDRIMGISRRIKRSMDETLSGFGLTWGEWTVLGSLRHEQTRRASPGALARKHELSSGAMTNRLDHLEGAGPVKRMRDDSDRRTVLVELTPKGKRVHFAAMDAQAEKEALIAAALPEKDKRQLESLLRSIMLTLEKRVPKS
jgi:DNA-binding MarR family transcriptional regulator